MSGMGSVKGFSKGRVRGTEIFAVNIGIDEVRMDPQSLLERLLYVVALHLRCT